MKKLMHRLASCRGESLVESMVSILIFTLASVLFLTMVTSATRINKTVKESDAEIQVARTAMESKENATADGTVTISVGGQGYYSYSVKVNSDNGLYAYYPVTNSVEG